jgi:hypothetical protein
MVTAEQDRMALHRTRQTDRQRLHRSLQRTLPRGVSEHHWFPTLDDARSKLEDWRRYYNGEPRMGQSGKEPPSRYGITMANPARHRDKAGKLYLPAIQSSVSEQMIKGSSHRWMKLGAHVKTNTV